MRLRSRPDSLDIVEPWTEEQWERFRRQIVVVRVLAGSVAGLVLSAFPIYYSTLTPLTPVQWGLYLGIALAGAIFIASLAEWLMRRWL